MPAAVAKPQARPQLIAIYADESCIGNGREGDNPGGAGGVMEWLSNKSGKVKRWDYWISEPSTTNNRMALRSVIEAFKGISASGKKFHVVFTTDSRYIVDGMTSWVHGWAARGWKRKGGPIENLVLWREALAAIGEHECEWRWVRGHNGQPQNEYANHLATRAAAEQSNSGGLIPSEFEEWFSGIVAAQSVKSVNNTGVVKGVVAVQKLKKIAIFPDAETFKPSKKIW
jgi:ribonuclease HI